jgi:hypothetical protein
MCKQPSMLQPAIYRLTSLPRQPTEKSIPPTPRS